MRLEYARPQERVVSTDHRRGRRIQIYALIDVSCVDRRHKPRSDHSGVEWYDDGAGIRRACADARRSCRRAEIAVDHFKRIVRKRIAGPGREAAVYSEGDRRRRIADE